jgi:hypothetical protein
LIEIEQILHLRAKLHLHLLEIQAAPSPTAGNLVCFPPPASRAPTASRSPASSTLPRVAPKMGLTDLVHGP